MWRERIDREDGVALIYVLFATVIISGLVVVFMSRVLFETRSTAQARDFEAAVHVAEAGAEELFGVINAEDEENKYVTEGPDPDNSGTVGPHKLASGDDEEAWAIARAEAAAADSSNNLVTTDGGQGYGIRPQDADTGKALDIVYGVGFVPSVDADNRRVRVVKMQIARRHFSPDHALLFGGGGLIGGNAEIRAPGCDTDNPDTCNADVHANGDMKVQGSGTSSHLIQGNLTASGAIDGTPNTEGGTSSGGEEEEPVPSVRARDFYNRDTSYNNDPQTGGSVEWYDLCVASDNTGVVKEPSTEPCTGNVIWPTGDGSTSFLGWTYQSGTNTWRATDVEAGVFYVHHADADVRGSAGNLPRAVSILLETDDASPGDSGSLQMSGNPNLVSALPDTLFVTDRDLKLKGTSNGGQIDDETCDPDTDPECDEQNYTGFMFVREQVDVSGTVHLEGALIAEDDEDLHGLVTRSTAGINGTMVLKYDDDLTIDLRGRVTVEFWNEL